GDFVDDDFVSVAPDGGLTAAANSDGFVPSTAAEDVDAFAQIRGLPLDQWMLFSGTETIQNPDLKVQTSSCAIAFAFYKSQSKVKFPTVNVSAGPIRVSYGVMVDGGGWTSGGKVPPWDPQVRQYAAGMALYKVAAQLSPKLQADALKIAAVQV